MKRYSTFRDHAGRVHTVEVSAEELRTGRKYWAGVVMIGVMFLIVSAVAAGII